jgi:hypothetical protein
MKDKTIDIGKFGIFYNEDTDKAIVIGKLKHVTKNGNCETEDGVYFDHFEPKQFLEILMLIQGAFKSYTEA